MSLRVVAYLLAVKLECLISDARDVGPPDQKMIRRTEL